MPHRARAIVEERLRSWAWLRPRLPADFAEAAALLVDELGEAVAVRAVTLLMAQHGTTPLYVPSPEALRRVAEEEAVRELYAPEAGRTDLALARALRIDRGRVKRALSEGG